MGLPGAIPPYLQGPHNSIYIDRRGTNRRKNEEFQQHVSFDWHLFIKKYEGISHK